MRSKNPLSHVALQGTALQSVTDLLDQLPGKKRYMGLNGPMAWPETESNIQELTSILDPSVDTVIFFDENWNIKNYQNTIELLASCKKFKNKNIYIISFGYKTEHLYENIWKLSFPWTMFSVFRKYNQTKLNFKPKNLIKGFGCLNNRPAEHRLMLGYELYRNNLLDSMIFTQNITSVEHNFGSYMFNELPGLDGYKSLLPIPQNHELTEYVIDDSVAHPAYQETYCNIVTETYTELVPYSQNFNYEFASEKSAKPFLSGQIPLMLACCGHMTYLKNLGFEIMDDLTPVEYDQMRTLEKISAIVDIVKDGRDRIEDFYFSHLKEIRHNFEIAVSGKVEQTLTEQLRNFVS